MVDDWSGGEAEEDDLLPSLEEILHGPGFDQEEYDRQLEEAFAELNSEIDLDLGIDPFAEDADLLEYDDPFADDEEDYLSEDWRELTSRDMEGDIRGPFPTYNDALIYANEVPLNFKEILYDDIDGVWYAYFPPSP